MSNDHQSTRLVPLPAFLQGTVAAMRFHRRAGEWDLQHAVGVRISDAWEALVNAFPWVHARTLSFASADGKAEWRHEGRTESSVDWLRGQVARSPEGYGFEAAFDLELAWVEPRGGTGRSLVPSSASCFLDVVDAIQTLTVWPNLFSDEISVCTEIPGDGFEEKPFDFRPAAAANRAMLESSLRSWERVGGGTIVSWDSELVEGVMRYGFDPDAKPL